MNWKAIALIAGFPIGFISIFHLFDLIVYGGFNPPFIRGSQKISGEKIMEIAESEADKYGNFELATSWYFHVTGDGVLHYAGAQRHDVIWPSKVDCSFTIIPKDGRTHFIYAVKFESDRSAYLVAVEDQEGEIVDSKPVSREASC